MQMAKQATQAKAAMTKLATLAIRRAGTWFAVHKEIDVREGEEIAWRSSDPAPLPFTAEATAEMVRAEVTAMFPGRSVHVFA